jgi:hypothetical protein
VVGSLLRAWGVGLARTKVGVRRVGLVNGLVVLEWNEMRWEEYEGGGSGWG